MHEHVLPDDSAVQLHDEVQLLYKGRILSQLVDDKMLQAAGTVHIPKALTDQIFYLTVVVGGFLADDGFHCIKSFL